MKRNMREKKRMPETWNLKRMGSNDDTGPEVLQFTCDALRIDDEWMTETTGGFTWWGHGLAQRVWAEACREDLGVDVTLTHVETDFLRNVGCDLKTMEGLNLLNAEAPQFAFVYDPNEMRIRLHATFYVHRQNVEWSKRLFMLVAGLQVSYAHMKAGGASHLFDGSEPDTSPHPGNGFRQKSDEILGVIDQAIIPESDNAEPIGVGEFRQAADCLSQQMLATCGGGGMTAEFPFSGDEPAILRFGKGMGVVTALFRAFSRKRHSLLGKGLLTTLQLPVSLDREEGLRISAGLNLLESVEWARCHMNGAWRIDSQDCLSFVSFLPIMSHEKGLLLNLAISNYIRSGWAAGILNAGSDNNR